MTTFQLCSDLHLEFGNKPHLDGNADCLLLAGDVCVANYFGRSVNSPYFAKAQTFREFFSECNEKYDRVLYVMGNHEHYHGRFEDTYDLLQHTLAPYQNVRLLENEFEKVGDVLVYGTTMWTDLNNGCPLTADTLRRSMNDYRVVESRENGYYHKLLPRTTHRVHSKSREKLETFLDGNKDTPVLVMTHHGPSHESVGERYRHEYYLNGGYVSDLTEVMLDNPNVKVWVHGHVHAPFDYMVGETRVLTNPHGYPNERVPFNGNCVFTL